MGIHLHATFVLANRAEIEDEIERLIGLLDTVDAPFDDMEPETDADHVELFGEASSDVGTAIMATLPAYGVDQSRGPTNEAIAYQHHRAAELGLVRTATGWRHP